MQVMGSWWSHESNVENSFWLSWDIYLKSSISGKLPQQFCGTWWVENDDTAEKAILVWPDIFGLIKHLAFSPSRRLKNSESFDKLTQSVNDKLMIIKLKFLKEVEHILNEFLRPFQNGKPMVHFLCDAYDNLLRRLIKMFALGSTVENLETPYSPQKFCVTNKDTHRLLKQIHLPTALKVLINKSECSGTKIISCKLFFDSYDWKALR